MKRQGTETGKLQQDKIKDWTSMKGNNDSSTQNMVEVATPKPVMPFKAKHGHLCFPLFFYKYTSSVSRHLRDLAHFLHSDDFRSPSSHLLSQILSLLSFYSKASPSNTDNALVDPVTSSFQSSVHKVTRCTCRPQETHVQRTSKD